MPEISDFIPELVCLGIDAAFSAGLYTAYRSTCTIIEDLSTAPELSINSALKDQIITSPIAQCSLKDGSVRVPYAIVRGSVAPLGKTVTSAYSPEIVTGVIQNVKFTEHKKNLNNVGMWVDAKKTIHEYTNDAPFSLVDNLQGVSKSLSRPKVEVVDWSDATRIDLDTVFDKFEHGPNSFSSHIAGWVAGDMHKGIQITEKMLLTGTNLTAVGELVSTPLGVKLLPPSDDRPYFLVRGSLSSLIKEYESGRTFLKVCFGCFAGFGIVLAAMTIYKYYKKRKVELLNKANEDTLNNIRTERSTREPRGDIPESLQCVVCLGAEREVILLNCGHVCVCADCGAQLVTNNHSCPVCRADILSVLPAYVS